MNWWESSPAVEPVSASGGRPPAIGGNWWDGAPAVESTEAAPSGAPKQDVDLATRAGMALNRNVIAPVLGAPATAANALSRVSGAALDATLSPQARALRQRAYAETGGNLSGSESLNKSIADVGRVVGVENANPESATPATTLPEKIAEGVGEGVGMAVLPGLGAEALLSRAVQQTASFGAQLAKIIAGSGATSNALMGAGGGALGVVAEEAAPEKNPTVLGQQIPVREVMKVGGEIVGGGVTALAETGVRAAGRATGATLTGLNPNVAAARKIVGSAENPQTMRGQVDDLVADGPAVEGSNPNMFQLTGDKKLGELQREVATRNPGAHLDVLEEQSVARTKAMNAVADPNADPQAVGSFVRQQLDNIEAEYGAAVTKARQDAEGGLAGAGGTQFDNPADYGGGLGRKLTEIDRAKKEAEDAVWASLRETAGNKAIPFGDVTKGIADIEGSVGRLAEKPTGREKAIYDTIRGEGEYVTFNDIADIRSRITTALREDRELTGQGRSRLRSALEIVDGSLDAEVARVAADPSARTALLQKLGMDGLTAENVEQYGTARALTRERKATTGEGVVGDVVGGDVTESLVLGRLLKRPEDLRAFVNAAGDSPETMAIAQDALAFDMRKVAVKDGILSPQKLQGWMEKNAEAMRQFPELQAKFTNARAAQDALDTAIANQKAAAENFQTDSVKKFLADKDPHAALDEAMRTPEAFRNLVTTVKEDPDALAGLKRLAVELILRKGGVVSEGGTLAGAKEAGTSETPQMAANAVQRFFLNKKGLLGEIFDKAELANIEAVTADMQRAARTVKIPDSSGTPQDTRAMVMGVLGGLVKNIGGGAAGGALVDPIFGTAAGAAGGFLKTVYQGRIDRAVADMMLDPRKFAAWAPKVGQPGEAALAQMNRKMRALLGQEAMQALDRMDEEDRQ
jgi:hypothetical protein